MSTFFVHVIAPMDDSFVGPFGSREQAEMWCRAGKHPSHDGYVMTEEELRANILEFGEVEIQEPTLEASE